MLALLATVVAAGTTFNCTPVAVWDGDGPIWCAEGPHVRIAGIAAREMDGRCLPGHPCPDAQAIAARNRLVDQLGQAMGKGPHGHILIRSRATLRCVSAGGARGDRTAARCILPGGEDLSCEMLRTGTVARWDRYLGDDDCRS